ncbi:MAG: glycosyltransferase family 9 protein [Planctomycetota bacterium]
MAPPRYLFLRLSALGDVIFALEALHALKQQIPEARVDWAVEDRARELLEGHPLLERVLVYPRKELVQSVLRPWRWPAALRALTRFVRELRAVRYDAVLDLHGNLKSALHMLFSRGLSKYAFRPPRAKELSHLVANRLVSLGGEPLHRAEQGRRMIAELLGKDGKELPPGEGPLLPPRSPEREKAGDFLASASVRGPTIVLAPGSSSFARFKRWPVEQFRELARRLEGRGHRVIVCTGPGEEALAEAIGAASGNRSLWLDGARQGLGVTLEVLRRAAVVVAADSGPLHMAQAVGTRAVALFGPKDPSIYGPRLEGSIVLRHPMPCMPCGERGCGAPLCVQAIAVEEVEAAIHKILSERPEVLILRHYKENRKKCTLEPLLGREDLRFVEFRPGKKLAVDGYILLQPEAPELGPEDRGRPLLLLDSTWRYLEGMRACLEGAPHPRALPLAIRTAYPRGTVLSEEPRGGLASIEALYAALRILGHRDDSLLDEYHWREEFLEGFERRDCRPGPGEVASAPTCPPR